MIPRKIHYCWFGPAARSALGERCLEGWRRVMPDYELKEWNEANSPLDAPYVRAALRAGGWSKAANYVRGHALYTEGGLYLDTDVEVLKSFDPLLRHDAFLGFQAEDHPTDWVNNAVWGSRAGHPFARAYLDGLTDLLETRSRFARGPDVMTALLRQMGLKTYGFQEIAGVALYPLEYFYPFSWLEASTPERVKEATYCIHHWEKSWRDEPERAPFSLRRELKRFLARGFRR
ncbi:MAG TPA: glycosyltransferase [Planctomycetota bacterium]|nr:glycosyltransferase [Planctomycetota bacterium]